MHWKIHGLSQVSGMLTISSGSRDECATFNLQPSPGSRKIHLIDGYQKKLLKHKTFVTNNHILLQFEVPVEVSEETLIGGKKWIDLQQGVNEIDPMSLRDEEICLYESMKKAQSELRKGEEFGSRVIKILQTIVMRTDRVVVTQSREIRRYLDSKFMGESQLKNGRSYYAV